jgi:Leucine-rich repeat (LRR) protein
MKNLLLVLAFTVMAGVTFSQSKKEQIEILTNRVDSLNSVLNAEKNISTETSNKISALNTNVTKLTSELQTSKAESTSKQQKIDILQSLLKIKTDSLGLVKAELKKYNNANQIVNIPDANFKAYIVRNRKINTNGDKEIQLSEASAFNGEINCWDVNISNLKGIEAFTALTGLNCGYNQLTSLDVSKNTALTYLYCSGNQLTSLDASKNTALTSLYCGDNKFDCDALKRKYGID